MPCTVTRLPDEPIVIVKVDLPLDRHITSVRSVWRNLNHLAAQQKQAQELYGILDLSYAAPSYADVLLWLAERSGDPPPLDRAAQLRTLVVGTHPLLPVGVRKVKHQLGVTVDLYTTIDDALHAARAQAREQPDDD